MTAASPGPTAPATVPGGASVSRLVGVVAELAAPAYTGRRVGTPGGRAAAAFLAEAVGDLGAAVTTTEFLVAGVRELYATPQMTWTDKEGLRTVLVHRRDFAEHLVSADVPDLRAGLLAGGEAVNSSGRWLLVQSLDSAATARAVMEGAAGLLVPRGVDAGGWMPKMIAGPAAVSVPVAGVRTEWHQQMTVRGGEVSASVPLRTVAVTGINVHGVFAAPGPGEVSVLLTAHYDGVGDDPERSLPAAADNASGCAVILEAARLLAPHLPPGAGLAVAFLDGEEVGAVGSAHHAPQLAPGTLVINVDGAAKLSGAAAVEAGGPAHALLAALDQAGREVGVPLRAAAMQSDNRRYAAAGLASVGIGMGMPGYQTPAETLDRVQPETLTAATELIVATVRRLIAAS